jgi:uncharacterized membrane protein
MLGWTLMYRTGGLNPQTLFGLWIGVIVATIILNIAGNIIASIVLSIIHAIRTGSNEPERFVEDERDKLIALKGTQASYTVFSIGVFLSMLTFALGQPPLVMFSLIILFSIVAATVGEAWQLYLYQRELQYA